LEELVFGNFLHLVAWALKYCQTSEGPAWQTGSFSCADSLNLSCLPVTQAARHPKFNFGADLPGRCTYYSVLQNDAIHNTFAHPRYIFSLREFWGSEAGYWTSEAGRHVGSEWMQER
jgi:hypothetical protein